MNIEKYLSAIPRRDLAKEHKILSSTSGTEQFFALMKYGAEQDILEAHVDDEIWRANIKRLINLDPYDPGPYGDKHEEILDEFAQGLPDPTDNQPGATHEQPVPF